MAWRAVMRRCPGRSMTLVGDLAQTGSAAGARSWAQVLDAYVPSRWRLEELTITYRTPEQIMEVAADVLAASGSALVAPRSVRASDWDPTSHAVGHVDAATLAPVVRAELDLADGGRIAVVVPRSWAGGGRASDRLATELAAALPGTVVGARADALDADVAVLDVDEVKGLEFDAVVLCEPAEMVGRHGGWGDLYVAVTRPTQRLRVVHAEALPAALSRLKAVG